MRIYDRGTSGGDTITASTPYRDIYEFTNLTTFNTYTSTNPYFVDVDYENVSSNDILRIKTVLNDCEPNGRNIIGEIPTPNGIHIITRPFNTQQFLTHQDVFYKCEIKKNNPTILYSNLNKNL